MVSSHYIQARYRFWSTIYDSIIDKIFHFDRSKVIRNLDIKKGDKILEVGVGTGLNLRHYPPGCTVYGIDFSNSMLQKARKKKSSAKIILHNCDAKDLKFETNFFDKVLATYVLRVAPNPFKIMSEVSRVSKNGASFVIVDKFKEGNYFLHNTIQKISLFLGWGKDYNHKKLCKGTAWQSVHKEKLHSISASRIVILQNKKKVSHSKKSY